MKINITKRFLLSLCLMTLTLLCGENKAWGQAKLPVSFNGGKGSLPTGFTQNGLGTDYSASTKLKFDDTGDYLIVHFDSDPSKFSCLVKQYGTGTSSNKFDIQYSTDGSTYKTFNTVTNIGDGKTQTVSYDFSSLKGVRYIKWIYTKKGKGNYGLGKISIEKATSTPTFSLTEGTYNGPQHVTITAPDGYTEGIAYTTDGSDPTTSGTAKDYSDAGIDITTTTTLRAVAYDSELNFSGEATAKYTITYNAPTFSLPGGTYYGDQSVTISVADPGTGSILYTTNGTDPKTNGNAYTGAISLPVGTKKLTLKAVAKYGEGLFSDVTEATYDIQKAPSTFYQRITSADELTENGSYLIVCESESVAFGEINSSDKGTPQAVTITDDKIYLSAAGTGTPTEFILEVSGSNYKLKNASTGEYINVTASSTDITETASGTALNIEINSDNTANIEIATQGSTPRQILYKISTTSFGNYASSNLTNPQNKADYGTVYLYKKHIISDFTFSDTEDLKASLPTTSPLADQTVTLNRNLYSGWNTFCVPFALTQKQLEEAYGSGAVAKYLSDVTTDGAAATLHFTPEAEGGIKANKAYLLYLTADVTEAKTFSGVTLQPAGDCTTTVRADNGGDYTFQGILTPTALETNDRQYFLNSAGTYFVLPLNNTSQMKATRAYIIVPAPAAPAQGRQYRFDFNGTTTAIDNVNVSGMEDGAWYTISGICVNRPAAKGVYIHNGRKVIVK